MAPYVYIWSPNPRDKSVAITIQTQTEKRGILSYLFYLKCDSYSFKDG